MKVLQNPYENLFTTLDKQSNFNTPYSPLKAFLSNKTTGTTSLKNEVVKYITVPNKWSLIALQNVLKHRKFMTTEISSDAVACDLEL